ncbi:UNVERIFIED_CONTAM: hypothetical protein FKN15_043787 [Acipenser sinensis]
MSRDSSLGPKGVAAGYGLLAAAQALNSSVGPGRASQSGARMEHFDYGTGSGLNMQGSRSHYSPSTGSSHGMAASFDDQSKGQDAYASQGRSPLDKARSLFASLGLSAEEFEVLSNVPEEKLNVETLPRLIMQLKSQRAEERGLPSRPRDNLSPPREQPYRPVRDDWDEAVCSRPDSKKESNAVPRVFNYNYGQQREGPSRSYERLDYEERMGGSDRYPELSRGHYESEYDRRGPAPVPERSFMERRTGFPSLSKIEDYHGILPSTFPHVCTLCDFDVHSIKITDSKVVVIQFAKGKCYQKDLVKLAEPFGTVNNHLVLLKKAFLEMRTHEEAAAMVKYYQRTQAVIRGQALQVYLSTAIKTIQPLIRSGSPGMTDQSSDRVDSFDLGTSSDASMQGQDACGSQSRRNVDKAMNLFTTLGLSPEDLDSLTHIPEDQLTVETLPKIIMQLKAQRAEEGGTASKRSRDDRSSSREQPNRAASKPSGVVKYGQLRKGSSRSYERLDYDEGKGGGSDRYPEPSRGHYESEYDRRGPASVPERSFMERRTGSPSLSKIEDYHGILPKTFPHVCTLCDFDVHSVKVSRMDSQEYDEQRGGKVVVAKYLNGTCYLEDLLELAEPFGTVVNHLAVVNKTPGRVRAPTQSQDSGYAVVYICNLPPSDFKDSELIELAKRVKPGTASHRGKDSSSSSSGGSSRRTNETSGKSKRSRSRERASTAKEEGGSSGKEEQEEPGDQESEVMDMENNALEEEEGVELGEEEDPEEPDPFLDCTETPGEEPKEQSLESSETQEEGQVEASLETSTTQGEQAEKECLESLETQVEQPAEKSLEGLETQEEETAEKPPEGPGTQGVEPLAKAPDSLETPQLEMSETSLERSETQREAPGEEE